MAPKGQTYRVIRDNNLSRAIDPIHALKPIRPSILIHPGEHDLPRFTGMSRRILVSAFLAPLGREFPDCRDDTITFCTRIGHRNQDNEWLALCVHHFLERSFAELQSRRPAVGL